MISKLKVNIFFSFLTKNNVTSDKVYYNILHRLLCDEFNNDTYTGAVVKLQYVIRKLWKSN